MINKEDIKIIGFDLDQTLFPKSPEIDLEIQKYIYQKISEFKKIGLEEAKNLFYFYYPGLSGRKTLIKLGFPEDAASNIIQEALENADISRFLIPDSNVLKLLQDCKKKYISLALITGSSYEVMNKKLKALQIPKELFDCIITGEISKTDGTAYKNWMSKYVGYENSNFLYIGDRRSSDVDVPLSLGMQAILVNIKEKEEDLNVPQLNNLLDLNYILLEE